MVSVAGVERSANIVRGRGRRETEVTASLCSNLQLNVTVRSPLEEAARNRQDKTERYWDGVTQIRTNWKILEKCVTQS